MEKKRLSGLDAVRTAAIVFVIIIHSIALSQVLDGERNVAWHICLYLRQLSAACVPLFLMLSGYLQKGKCFSVSYYCGIIPLYISYFVISALCVGAYAINGYIGGNMDMTFVTAVYQILNFTANGYSWYFEMFIGLFLLIPLLNMVYTSIATKRGKLILIGIFAFLTLMPDTIAGFSPYYDGSGSTVALNIFPDFFKSLYPVTFYFMGSYIAEFKPHISCLKKVCSVLLAPLISAIIIAAYSHARGGYAWYVLNGFQTVTVALVATAVFLALYDLDVRPAFLEKAVECISKHTFEMYLLSYLWDNLFYSVLGLGQKLPIVLMMILVLTCSFVSAWLLRLLLTPFSRLVMRPLGKLLADKEAL